MGREKFNRNYFDRYNSGESIWCIAASENTTYKKIFESVFDRRFEAKLLPDNEKKYICDQYLSGISSVQLGKKYGIGHKSIAVVLEENNIKRNCALSERKYGLNEHYFDEIDTPNKAYILGLLYADGNNCKQKGTIRIQLQEQDKEILEKICKELNYEKELRYIDCSKRIYGNGYVSKNMYSLDIFSMHMCNTLEKCGVVPNKSLILAFPDFVPDNLYPHFIRGYIDGDGCISKKSYCVSITSTEEFCVKLKDLIKCKLGIDGNIKDSSCHNGITKVFCFTRRQQTQIFLDYVYNNAELYLQRKYDIYLNRYK